MVEIFGAISSRWRSLRKLRIDYEPPDLFSKIPNGFDILCPLLDRGCLPSVEELRITATRSVPERTGRWEHLKRLDIVELTAYSLYSMLSCVDQSALMGDFPTLQTICLLTDTKYERSLSIDRLRQTGVYICVVDPNLEKIMVNAGLT